MVLYITHKEIDKEKWDRTIDGAPNGLIYAFSWYLDIVSPGWDALIMDDYTAIMALPYRRKWGFRYLFRPDWCQQLGIISKGPVSKELLDDFIGHIPGDFKYIDLPLNHGNIFESPEERIIIRDNFILPLSAPYSELYGNYSTNTQRNLRKAEAAIPRIGDITGIEQLVDLKWKHAATPLKKEHNEMILGLLRTLVARNRTMLKGAFDNEGHLLAGVLFMHHRSRWIYLVSASSREGKENSAMFLLIDQFIDEHAETDAVLDFEGSTIPALARFFKGFGAIREEYPVLHINKLPWPIRLLKSN